MVTLISI